MVWLNKGTIFEPIPLPNAGQMGPILKTLIVDINGDKYPDLIIRGDVADTEPETPAFGMVLLEKGDGSLDPVWLKKMRI